MKLKLFFKNLCSIFIALLLSFSLVNANETTISSVNGIVENVKYVDINTDSDDSIIQTKQTAEIRILNGDSKGRIVELDNMLSGNPYYDIKLKKNSKVILHAEDNGDFIEYSIEDIKRSQVLTWLSLIFFGLLLYVGKKKGICSLFSIGLTVLTIKYVLSPLILFGWNPILLTILTCCISTATTMYLVGGINSKSTSAILGTIFSLIVAGILSSLTMIAAQLTGFTDESSIFLYSAHPELNFVHITISAIIIATLGAVMDVAMSISSTINEINEIDNSKTKKELFTSGMNVGKDIIGTMANTLILVYLGGALPLLLLSNSIDLNKFINLNQVVTEISSALIGSIAIVVCVPITAIIASGFIKNFSSYNKKTPNFDIKKGQ